MKPLHTTILLMAAAILASCVSPETVLEKGNGLGIDANANHMGPTPRSPMLLLGQEEFYGVSWSGGQSNRRLSVYDVHDLQCNGKRPRGIDNHLPVNSGSTVYFVWHEWRQVGEGGYLFRGRILRTLGQGQPSVIHENCYLRGRGRTLPELTDDALATKSYLFGNAKAAFLISRGSTSQELKVSQVTITWTGRDPKGSNYERLLLGALLVDGEMKIHFESRKMEPDLALDLHIMRSKLVNLAPPTEPEFQGISSTLDF